MRDVFGAGPKAQLFKLHTQTSGRSLIAAEFKNNLTRTAVELMLAYMNATNSCSSATAPTNRSQRQARNGFGLPRTGRRSCWKSRACSNT